MNSSVECKLIFFTFETIYKQLLRHHSSLQDVDIAVHDIWRFLVCVIIFHVFLLAFAYRCIPYETFHLWYIFFIIRWTWTYANHSNSTSAFFSHTYLANPDAEKSKQDQAHIFLCTCCGSFRTLSDSCKFLSCLSVTFHWIFPSYSCAHMDRQLSETSNKICSFLRHIICKCCCLHIWILICWLSCIQDEAYNFHVCPCRVLWQDYSGLDMNLKLPMIFI